MDYLLDDQEVTAQFRTLLREINLYRNGEVADQMAGRGIRYKTIMGVPVASLKEIAKGYNSSHLLALKLWNREWRETMILATMLEEPGKVTEQQMDFWTKSIENCELAEQLSANLWWKTPLAFVKALEWCRGKKHWIRYTGVHLAGKLARMATSSPDEMFEPFFEEFLPLSKDPALHQVLYRTLLVFAERSDDLRKMVSGWKESLPGDNPLSGPEFAWEADWK
jgi:hypothetical protein